MDMSKYALTAILLVLVFVDCAAGFKEAQIRSKAIQSESQLKTLVVALESYRSDQGHYPIDLQALVRPRNYIKEIYLSQHTWPNRWKTASATKVNIDRQFKDPFRPSESVFYWSDTEKYILAFRGPDRKFEVDKFPPIPRGGSGGQSDIRRNIVDYSYDPTNGVMSSDKDYFVLGSPESNWNYFPEMIRN